MMASYTLDCMPMLQTLVSESSVRRRLGQSIARKRLLVKGDGNPNVTIHPDESSLVGLGEVPPTVSVDFLDGHQTLISADACGKICIHRLPVGSAVGQQHSTEGQKLSKILELPPVQGQQMSVVKLFPLSDGESFCVGLPSGDYHVYSRNHERWTRTGRGTALPPISKNNPSNYCGYQVRGAQRRYHRDFLTDKTLWNQLSDEQQSSNCYYLVHTSLSEISDWDFRQPAGCIMTRPMSYHWMEQSDYLPGRHMSMQNDDARWAFFETSSTILSAFVDPERDCFTVMDHRHGRPVVHCTAPSSSSSKVGGQEDISAVCFLSDQTLVTAHASRGGAMRNGTHSGLYNAIKLWDIRYMSENVDVDVTSSSFPFDTMHKGKPTAEWVVIAEDGTDDGNTTIRIVPINSSETSKSTSSTSADPHQHITRLTPCGGTKIMITLQQSCDKSGRCNKLVLYDLLRNKICSEHTCPESTATKTLPVVAIPPRNSSDDSLLMATCETIARAATQISVFDLSATKDKSSREDKTASRKARKRPWNEDSGEPKSAIPTNYLGSIRPTEIEDRFGIRTRITSLAWNASGTALVGGSLDGDVFVWDSSTDKNDDDEA
jgi:hypothetical protein